MDKKEYDKQRYINLKNEYISRNKQYRKTPMGRAINQIAQYKRMDIRNGFGDAIDFDAKWMIENIYTKKCAHCDETDWHKLGCNRLDNSKPHTKNNVEPCCKDCNDKLAQISRIKPIYQYTLDFHFVKRWSSAKECGENGYDVSNIRACCVGKHKTHKGYRWYYQML